MAAKKKNEPYWSAAVTKKDRGVLILEPGVFTWSSPRKIARSLKASAEKSKRRKGSVLQSSMSMLNFYINRAGSNLNDAQKKILEQAKIELRKLCASMK